MKPIDRLRKIMARLRDKKKGCPWDVEQTSATIAPHTLEEAYEVVDAIEREDTKGLREELGDLLLQVVFHAQMAEEKKLFTFDDVAEAICDKLEERHPHVFGDAVIKTAEEQTEAWEKHKESEKKKKKTGTQTEDPFEDVPLALPAMTRALKLQKRAARQGFEWRSLEDVFEKLHEEVQEFWYVWQNKKTREALTEEIGDMLFCCVSVARKAGVDPEEAMRFCNRKFVTRFRHMQTQLDAQQRDISDASLQELNDLWDQAKIAEKSSTSAANG